MSLDGISVKKGAPTDLLQCPYVPSHMIELSRMQFHLTKCRKNFSRSSLKTCPFDSTHRINEPELNFHMTICQSRGTFDEFKYRMEPTDAPVVNLAPVPVLPELEENWEDCATPSYDPTEYLKDAKVSRMLRGGQPAERRAHRLEQRQKLAGTREPE